MADETREGATFVAAALEAERGALMRLAYRLLGTVADAEDAVQETYTRWYRLSDDDRAAVANVGGWLMRVASRICLDQLGSARARRERYVGDWLPEPLPDGDPLERVTLDESVSAAFLIVLDAMTPAERVSFVLHDVFGLPFDEIAEVVGRTPAACRQLAVSARRHVREGRAGASATQEQHDEVVRAFLAAAAGGELAPLVAVLDPDVRLVSDGGGLASATRRPVLGSDRVARYVLGIVAKRSEMVVAMRDTVDGLVLTGSEHGVTDTVMGFDVQGERITRIWVMRNPEKLARWNA